MDVSENRGTPKSSILIGFSIINHPFWGTPIFGNTHMIIYYTTEGDDMIKGPWNRLQTVFLDIWFCANEMSPYLFWCGERNSSSTHERS